MSTLAQQSAKQDVEALFLSEKVKHTPVSLRNGVGLSYL